MILSSDFEPIERIFCFLTRFKVNFKIDFHRLDNIISKEMQLIVVAGIFDVTGSNFRASQDGVIVVVKKTFI